MAERNRAAGSPKDAGAVVADLSDDAKALAGCLWGSAMCEKTVLTFQMRENRPTARCQAALDALTAAGFLYRESISGIGVSYRPLGPDMRRFSRFAHLGNFAISEPISTDVTHG